VICFQHKLRHGLIILGTLLNKVFCLQTFMINYMSMAFDLATLVPGRNAGD